MKFNSHLCNKNYIYQKVANEQGSVLIIALMLMAVLAILGVVASNTSITEMRVAANEQSYSQTFYAADAAWQIAPALLDSIGSDAPEADVTTKIVDLIDTTEKKINGIPYTYTVTELGSQKAEGSGEGHRKFEYQIESTALDPVTNKEKQKIRVVVNKLYQVGYGN